MIPNIDATPYSRSNATSERQKRQQDIALGVGGAGSTVAVARKVESAESSLQKMVSFLSNNAKTVNKNTKTVNSLFQKFKLNKELFTNNLMTKLAKVKNTKIATFAMKNPVVRKFAGATGGALAFFVLVSGVNKAVKTGEIAVQDYKFNQMQKKFLA